MSAETSRGPQVAVALTILLLSLIVGGFSFADGHDDTMAARRTQIASTHATAVVLTDKAGAHLAAARTSLEVLGALLLEVDVAAGASVAPAAVGPAPGVDLKTVWWDRGGRAGGGLELKDGDRHAGVSWIEPDWTGLHHSPAAEPLVDVIVEDCEIRDARKWSSRMYRVRGPIHWNRVRVAGVALEHAYYHNLSGLGGRAPVLEGALADVCERWSWCDWVDVGSQAIQLVAPVAGTSRVLPQETIDAEQDNTPGGWIIVEDCRARNIGWNRSGSARASFAFSFFDSARIRNHLRVSRLELDNSAQETSRGLLLVEARPYVLVEDSTFSAGMLEQPLAIIRDVDDGDANTVDVWIRRCEFEAAGGQNWIQFERCGQILVEGCGGDTLLKVDGVDIGSVADGYRSTELGRLR